MPVCLLTLGLVYWTFNHLLVWFFELGVFWLVLILFFFGGIIWGLFKLLSGLLVHYTSKLAPNRVFSLWTIIILCAINGFWAIYNSWTMDINYSGENIFAASVFTFLVIELSFALMQGAAMAVDD